ncbi:MAG: ABC transporter ATP-binding protein [Gammaproteobacteria bacterium]|nr:ABC transporter ATP-binding protein [Gammaproteobacteria bacterium]
MNPMLQVRGVSHGPRTRRRLQAIDFDLMPGERLGLLGVNGAGKSTLLQLLAGVTKPDEGEIRVMGERFDNATARARIGYLPQRLPLYGELTVTENLAWAAMLHGLHNATAHAAIDRALQMVALGDVRHRLAGRLSAGMAQRLALAQALVHQPQILILDEPTAGLDPLQTEQLRELLATLDSAISLVLATHLLDDVQQLCSRVLLLDGGHKRSEHIVAEGTDLLAHLRGSASPPTGANPA